jgi:hypothetical protein
MAKHPSSFKLTDSEGDITAITEPKVVYEGSVRQLCPLAPNNVSFSSLPTYDVDLMT